MLLFKECVRIKKDARNANGQSVRDLLFSAVADYNKSVTNRVSHLAVLLLACAKAWKVNGNTKRLIYSLLRCPPALTNLLKTLYSQNKPEHSGPTH